MANKQFQDLTEQTSPADNDVFAIQEYAGNLNKKTKWGSIKSRLDTFFLSLSSGVGTALDTLAGLVSGLQGDVSALESGKANRASTPTAGNVAGVDVEGDVTDTGIASANVVTASANFADDEILLGAGANKTAKKSGKVFENEPTDDTAKVTTSKYLYDNIKNNLLTEWTNYTPTVSASTGTITSYDNATARYKKVGKMVFVQFNFRIVTNGTGSARLLMSLPFSSKDRGWFNGYQCCGCGSDFSNGKALQMYIYTSDGLDKVGIVDYTGAYPGHNTAYITGTVTYEVA